LAKNSIALTTVQFYARKPPIAQPLDYETFITSKKADFDSDSQRELLLFPRDDISVSHEQGEPLWLLTQEALKLYNSPTKCIEFNYAGFSGDYDSRTDADLNALSFESDLALEEERAVFSTSNVICEGYLFIVPESGLLDNFKSAKKRYCIFRKVDEGKVQLELRKSPSIPPHNPPTPVKQVYLTKTKKGKSVLEVVTLHHFLQISKLLSYTVVIGCSVCSYLPVVSTSFQIEPFFVRLFLFDSRAGKRLSEEFRVSPKFGSTALPDNESAAGSRNSLDEDGLSVAQPHREIYVVARVERVLSTDFSAEIYMKSNVDPKNVAKQIKSIQQASSKLSKFRMPFAWAARPAFQEMLGVAKLSEDISLYKWDGNKMSDSDLQKVLNDLANEKSGKLVPLPNGTMTLSVDISARVSEFPMRISPSFTPILPWNAAPDTLISPSFQMQAFTDTVTEPYTALVNNLYVYPLLLKYDSQKIFNKARNIACTVQFIASNERGGNSVKALYDRFAYPTPFVHRVRCTVQHHEQNPTFEEVSAIQGFQIKIRLPLTLDPSDHLLFTFTHIAISSAMQKTNEIPAGYAWLPLVKNDRLVMENDEQEVALPVAADLPEGYITYQSLGLGKGHIGPDVRWVEGGKPLFRVRLRLISSAFTTETKLQSFFQGCQKLQKIGLFANSQKVSITQAVNSDDLELEKCNRYVEIDRLVPFLPIVLGRLLSLLPSCATEDMAITVLTLDFKSFKMVFSSERVGDETTHSAICKYQLLDRELYKQESRHAGLTLWKTYYFLIASNDFIVTLELLIGFKQKILQVSRRERFPPEVFFRIRFFVEQMIPLIVLKHRDIPQETRVANTAIGYFFRVCFNDSYIFFCRCDFFIKLLKSLFSNFLQHLREYKLDLLQILGGHEHWIPLALPLLCDSSGEIMKKDAIMADRNVSGKSLTQYAEEFTLTEGYCARHFLVGLLLQELQCSFREPRDYRRRTIMLVRNLLAKHSVDKRYLDSRAQVRIATLYLPLLRLVLDYLGEMEVSLKTQDSSEQTVASPAPVASSSAIPAIQSGSSFCSIDNYSESRDLLLCTMYILHKVPQKVFEAVLKETETAGTGGMMDFIRLLELTLEFFKYRGLKFTLYRTSGRSESLPFSVLQESNLTQEIALRVLDIIQILAGGEDEDQIFLKLLRLEVTLLGENWPDAVRLHTIASLAIFINMFRNRFFKTGPLEGLSVLVEALLLQLNSRLISIQCAAAALLHLVLRNGYEYQLQSGKIDSSQTSKQVTSPAKGKRRLPKRESVLRTVECLGRPGSQTGVALARYVYQKCFQIRVADLHIQLADSYRGSSALRSAWFDTLAETHMRDRWFSEAAVCECHVLAIIAKELALSENVFSNESETVEKAGFTMRNFTSKVEKTIQTLLLAERYEAIGPICRLAIPLYEKLKDYRALVSMYVELQQAYSLADQVKITGKRHLGAYFRVFFYNATLFGEEHKTEWIYREPGLTSLAEAYERMTNACQLALGHEKVQIVPEKELDESKLDKGVAYVQMTHVEPAVGDCSDKTSFDAHTNLRRFIYECNDVDKTVPADAPTLARQALKKIYLTSKPLYPLSALAPFPNTCRRQRVVSREELFMNPLELAVDKLTFKADQIKKIIEQAAQCDGTKKSLLARLDVKGLQLLLQGAVQPTVNVGPLAYAEAFTAPAQVERYGQEGVKRLSDAFRKLMSVCADALQINEVAIGSDQAEYQQMLKNGFVAMMERLNSYFGDSVSFDFSNPNDSIGGLNA
uniref:C2 DOCK-type domain-containing protein n=1 Tax=Enterobius vermicularis TaxID=51028 RepID=A0A158Q9N1_ENTVE